MTGRRTEVSRRTRETSIKVSLNLDGTGAYSINTGMRFLDHMLASLALHGLFDLHLKAEGDLPVDDHHLVEDVAICLGEAMNKALGERVGIFRFGSAIIPMNEALVLSALDLSTRFHYVSNLSFKRERVGDLATEMVNHFFRSLAENGRFTLHLLALRGENDHHKAEAAFKSFGVALAEAAAFNPRVKGVRSEKGVM